MVTDEIKALLNEVLEAFSLESDDFVVEVPADKTHGDYSTNVALVSSKGTGKNPKELAEEIVRKLLEKKPDWVEKINIAGPGFINFTLTRDFVANNTQEVQKEEYGQNKTQEKQKILVEYTDPNPFKEFHIGHLMSNAIGESISRLLEFSGAEVKRANFQGDVGLHVAKAVWGLLEGETDVGTAYAKGAKAYEEDEVAQNKIKEINKKIYEGTDEKINEIYKKGKEESLKEFEKIYERLGTQFDFYIFESETGIIGKKLAEENPNVFDPSEGAVVYKGEKVGLHTRVFINSDGIPTYETKDLGNFKKKTQVWNPDSLVVITGNEITDYFRVVRAAASEIPELKDIAERTVHVPHGMLRLPTGKMSSRTGDVITAESLLDDVGEKLKDKINDPELLNAVSVGAIKYSMLKQEAGKDIVFDYEKSLSFVGDSGPYVQYTHARCRSLLKRGEEEGLKPKKDNPSSATLELEKELLHFPEVVLRATKEYAPHYVATYLHELASSFNTFYGKEPIVEKDDPESTYKLFVVNAVAETLKKGLYLLGIEAPEKM